MPQLTVAEALAALHTGENSDAPTTKRHITALLKELTPAAERIQEWVTELEALVGDVVESLEDLDGADADDRDDVHSQLVSFLGALLDEVPGARDTD